MYCTKNHTKKENWENNQTKQTCVSFLHFRRTCELSRNPTWNLTSNRLHFYIQPNGGLLFAHTYCGTLYSCRLEMIIVTLFARGHVGCYVSHCRIEQSLFLFCGSHRSFEWINLMRQNCDRYATSKYMINDVSFLEHVFSSHYRVIPFRITGVIEWLIDGLG